jgi:hypothetical protein
MEVSTHQLTDQNSWSQFAALEAKKNKIIQQQPWTAGAANLTQSYTALNHPAALGMAQRDKLRPVSSQSGISRK